MKHVIGAAAILLMASAMPASAGYVKEWLASSGGCVPPIVRLMKLKVVAGPVNEEYLGKRAVEWTDEDVAEYDSLFRACAHRWPNSVGFDLSDADIDHMVDETVDGLVGKIQAARDAASAARDSKLAEQDLALRAVETQRKALVDQAKDDRAAAERAAKMAADEKPLTEAAEADASQAKRDRLKAEQDLAAMQDRMNRAQGERQRDMAAAGAARQRQAMRSVENDNREKDAALSAVCKPDDDAFTAMRPGMSPVEVDLTLGCRGRQTSEFDLSGSGRMTTFSWEVSDGTMVSATFVRGRLQAKHRS